MSAAPPLLLIAGATATGKTGLSIEVADALRGEGIPVTIISADSRQVFRGLDIGTAKIGPVERRGIPHAGLDLVDPDESFSVADFARHAADVLLGVAAEDGLAIVVGGTGLYLRAVAGRIDALGRPSDRAVRAAVEDLIATEGLDAATTRLRTIAPMTAARIDLRNPRRVSRALEVAEIGGDAPPSPAPGYDGPVAWLGLSVTPPELARRIGHRARAQFDAGLIDEAHSLRERYDPALPAFSAIGYREAWAVLDGTLTVDEAVALDAVRNVRFAKRQGTWFRSEPDIEWIDATTVDAPRIAMETVRGLLGSRG